MKTLTLSTLLLSVAASTLLSTAVFAQETPVPDHPRVDQVDTRINQQQQRITNAETSGKITPTQAAHDQARLNKTESKLSADEAKHGGHITKKEEHKLNKSLDKNAHKISKQEHKDASTPTAR